MTYNSGTSRIRCGVCGSKSLDRSYYMYQLTRKKRATHLCSVCVAMGAYWCPTCEDVHAGLNDCPCRALPLNM